MRHALLLLALATATVLTAQPRAIDPLASDARKAEQLLRQGRPQSALTLLEDILRRARKAGDMPRQLQALHAIGQATLELQDEARRHHITRLRKELPEARGAYRALLHNMLGMAYWDYLQEHRWEMRDRRNTGGQDPDIDTWSTRDTHDAIAHQLRLSLAAPATLQAIPTRHWQPVVAPGTLHALRPTLYDLVAHAALDYFTRADGETPGFTDAFEIDDSTAFAPADRFAMHRFARTDSLANRYLALHTLQALLRHHLADTDPAALIDADLLRLRFVHEASSRPDKEERYLRALADLRRRHPAHPASAEAAFRHLALERGRLDRQDPAQRSRPGATTLNDIANGCRQLMARHPGSEGALHAERLLQDLQKRTLSLTAEKVNLPGRPFRLRTAFRNIDQMHYRIIALSDEDHDTLQRRTGDGFWAAARQLPHLRTVRQPLPDPGDLRPHAAEVRIDPLPVGRYLLLASPDAGFPLTGQPLSALVLHVSRIGWFSRGHDLFVLDRETGRPLHDANVRAWRAEYDYSGRTTRLEAPVSLRTDLDGYTRLPDAEASGYKPRRLDVAWKDDRLRLDENEPLVFSDDRAWTGVREDYESRYQRLFLFTDRKLYRPGQTVQFKGLFVTRDFDTRRPKVVADRPTVVYLRDANGDTRDSLALTTGAYGSFSGSFRLPARGRTGAFTLEADHGQAEVQVEEYRRPTFELAWQEAQGGFRLLDTVTVRGEARSFTGAAANGARVRYRVTRATRYPYPWYGRYFGWDPPADRTVEIAHGETVTGTDGGFRIPFPALPDRSVDPARLPVFEFDVSADVTDIGGETRSGTTTVRIGYHSIQLTLGIPEVETHPNDADITVDIGAANLSGGPRPTATTLTLRPLQRPARFLRERYWPLTDTTVLSEADYVRDFPNDPYRDEGNRQAWAAGNPVIRRIDTPRHGGQPVTLPTRGLPNGWYRLELSTTEADGRIVATRRDILLRDAATGLSDPYGYFSQHLSTAVAQPGETATLSLATALDDLWVIQLLDGYAGAEVPATHRPGGRRPTHTAAPPNPGHPYRPLGLARGTTPLDLPIGEEDRGGFGIGHVFVRHNRFHSHAATLAVPWRNRELDIRLTTWRDKTEPGSPEQWSLTLRGHTGERVAAEVLLSMYDASLDALLPFAWEKPDLFESYPYRYDRYMLKDWQFRHSFTSMASSNRSYPDKAVRVPDRSTDGLIWSRQAATARAGDLRYRRQILSIRGRASAITASDLNAYQKTPRPAAPSPVLAQEPAALNEVVVVANSGPKPPAAGRPVAAQFRSDFRETAFFLPDLRTDSSGAVSFRFTMPEALTQWKWQILAHTRELASALATHTVVTRKELMAMPNAPRFLREGDRLSLPVRITNLSDSERTGRARLELYDPANGQPVDGYFHNVFPEQYFTAPAGQSVAVHFTLTVPADYSRPVAYRILARTDRHADGEETTLPVLSNRQLVTESMPLRMEGLGTRDVRFEQLLQSGASPTLTQHRLTLEYATNPVWYAVKALPYLTAYPHECVEQSLNRFYANAVAARAANASPRIRDWVMALGRDSAAARRELASPVGRHASLRDILLEETPWVLEARDEERQRRSLSILFDTLRIAAELERAFSRVRSAQRPDGGFTWFPGGPSDRYMSQYVLAQLGRMRSTGTVPAPLAGEVDEVFTRGLDYIAAHLKADRRADDRQYPSPPSPLQVQALYALSCAPDHPPPTETQAAIRHFRRLLAANWQALPLQSQAMAALLLHRAGEATPAHAILRSLRERAVRDTALGMYWKGGDRPWYWHDAPIETQALLIETFLEVAGDTAAADRMRLWLLSKKQTERWESTRATADACRALLSGGSDWLAADRTATITLGTTTPTTFHTPDSGAELLASIDGDKVRPDMGHIRIQVSGKPTRANGGLGWGAAHWQYFEHLDRISAGGGPLALRKSLFRERMTSKGPALDPVTEETELHVGDRLVVRLQVRSDRDMEYVHLKDTRASGTEPADVLSEYRWQGRLGYYMSTRDASTNFFLPVLPKGNHTFEYVVFVSHAGRFPAGIATVECMYAPSFRGHSQSPLLRVAERKE